MTKGYLKSLLIFALCLGIFGTGLKLGGRIERAHIRGVSHNVNAPVIVPPADWYQTASFQEPAPNPTPQPVPVGNPITPTLGLTIAGLAALTVTFLNGIKSAVPQIGGWTARIMAVVIAALGAIAVAPPAQSALVTGGAALTAALSAMGVHDYLTGQSGGAAPAAK